MSPAGSEVYDNADQLGSTMLTDFDFADPSSPKAELSILYDGDGDPDAALRSPDNIDWADNGYIYAQEDRATRPVGYAAQPERGIDRSPVARPEQPRPEARRRDRPFGRRPGRHHGRRRRRTWRVGVLGHPRRLGAVRRARRLTVRLRRPGPWDRGRRHRRSGAGGRRAALLPDRPRDPRRLQPDRLKQALEKRRALPS